MKLSHSVSFRAGAAVGLAALLGLTACGPASPGQVSSPTPVGSHTAAQVAASPSASPTASSTDRGSDPSGSAAATEDGRPVLGLQWADGSPVLARPAEKPGAAADVRLTALPFTRSVVENWVGLTSRGVALATTGEQGEGPLPQFEIVRNEGKGSVSALAAKDDLFAASRASYDPKQEFSEHMKGGPFVEQVVPAGEGFVFTAIDTINFDNPRVRLFAVDKPGGSPRLLATFKRGSGAEDYVNIGDLAVGSVGGGEPRVYLAERSSTQSSSAATIRSIPLAGGELRTEATDAAQPMPTERGLYVLNVNTSETEGSLSAVTGLSLAKDGKTIAVLKAPESTDTQPEVSVSPDGKTVAWLSDENTETPGGVSVDVDSRAAVTESVSGSLEDDGLTTLAGGLLVGGKKGFVESRPGSSRSLTLAGLGGNDFAAHVSAWPQADGSVSVLIDGQRGYVGTWPAF